MQIQLFDNCTYKLNRYQRLSIFTVPKRLINTQCGSDYVANGPSNSYDDYIVPNGVNFYRLHPNYFFRHDGSATVKVRDPAHSSQIYIVKNVVHVRAGTIRII